MFTISPWIVRATFIAGCLFFVLGQCTGEKTLLRTEDDGGAMSVIGLIMIGLAIWWSNIWP